MILIINLIIFTFISCKSTNTYTAKAEPEVHNKETVSIPKAITLKERAGHYKSRSPYFVFDIELKENGYANVVLKGWMVYRGIVKVGDPNSEDKKFVLDIDNITHVIVEFKDLNNAKASVVLKDVVQQTLDMNRI